jgi:hypothetical protein
MKIFFVIALIATGIAATVIFAVPQPASSGGATNNARVPVLLELFTSEGCSSCPPADRLLEALDRQPVANAELIVVSEHVDYWNYLGWSDPYSSPLFSERQHQYAERLGTSVYTPQLVIDGQFQAVGSDQREVMDAIARAQRSPMLPISIRATTAGGSTMAHVEANSSGKAAELYIIVAADHARTQVQRGENGGRLLSHVAVAQAIVRAGKWEKWEKGEGSAVTARDVPIPSKPDAGRPQTAAGETRLIAILRDPQNGRVLGAAQTRM